MNQNAFRIPDEKSRLPLHICVLLVILAVSFIVTPEPYAIRESDIKGSFAPEDFADYPVYAEMPEKDDESN